MSVVICTGDQRPVTLMVSPHVGVIGPVMGQAAIDVSGQVRMIMPDAGVQDTDLEGYLQPGDVVCIINQYRVQHTLATTDTRALT